MPPKGKIRLMALPNKLLRQITGHMEITKMWLWRETVNTVRE